MKKTKKLLPLLALLLLVSCGAPQQGSQVGTAGGTHGEAATPPLHTLGETSPETSELPARQPLPPAYEAQFAPSEAGIYNYCPSIMETADGSRYIYYCTNTEPNRIVDHIAVRRGSKRADGGTEWGEEHILLSPTPGTWDAMHVCDPSVIAGEFSYAGEGYSYLMAYLGCTSSDNQENKLGLAVAKSPMGPFVKVGNAPLVDFIADVDFEGFQWGVGQASLVSIDKQGKVWLFYTRGDRNGTRIIADVWELSDPSAPRRESSEELTAKGLYDLNGQADFMNNADLVYDPDERRFYASSDCHPNPSDTPNYISSGVRVSFFTHAKGQTSGFSDCRWMGLGGVTPQSSGFPRNHNSGLLRDAYGHLPSCEHLTVFYAVSVTGEESLWSYRIYATPFALR